MLKTKKKQINHLIVDQIQELIEETCLPKKINKAIIALDTNLSNLLILHVIMFKIKFSINFFLFLLLIVQEPDLFSVSVFVYIYRIL